MCKLIFYKICPSNSKILHFILYGLYMYIECQNKFIIFILLPAIYFSKITNEHSKNLSFRCIIIILNITLLPLRNYN